MTGMGQVDFFLPVGTQTRFIFLVLESFMDISSFVGMTAAALKYLLKVGYFYSGQEGPRSYRFMFGCLEAKVRF